MPLCTPYQILAYWYGPGPHQGTTGLGNYIREAVGTPGSDLEQAAGRGFLILHILLSLDCKHCKQSKTQNGQVTMPSPCLPCQEARGKRHWKQRAAW